MRNLLHGLNDRFQDLSFHNVWTRPLYVYIIVMLGSILGFLGSAYVYVQEPSTFVDAIMAGFCLLFAASVTGMVAWKRRRR